jgi:hypothetical protein
MCVCCVYVWWDCVCSRGAAVQAYRLREIVKVFVYV